MPLTKQSIERLIDLAENKLSCICPIDRDDLKEITELESCIHELSALQSTAPGRGSARPSALKAIAG